MPQLKEMKKLEEKVREYSIINQRASGDFAGAFNQFKKAIDNKFSELKFYSLKARENFILSIFREENQQHKKDFLKYLERKEYETDFYTYFQEQIGILKQKSKYKNKAEEAYEIVYNQYKVIRNKKNKENYNLIFPNNKYQSLVLKDKKVTYTFADKEEYHLENTCEIRFVIANNRLSSGEIRKEPYIIRIDYRYLDSECRLNEKTFYIDNEITQGAQTGLEYVELDFYKQFVFTREPFKVTTINKDREPDNTFISVLSEFKHGVNDYTIKGQELSPLSVILKEIEDLTDEETRFKIVATESFPCLKECMGHTMINQNLFVQKIVNKKLPIIRKISKRPTSKRITENKDENKNEEKRKSATIKREDKYKQKIKDRSNNRTGALTYTASKERVLAKCNHCHHEWERRADHLLARPDCPKCR